MRRAVSTITVAVGLFTAAVWPAGAATAAPAPPAPAGSEAPPKGAKRCAVEDEKLGELSGLIATKTGYIVINDGTDDDSLKKVFYLNAQCRITKSVPYSGQGPKDTEDLALSPDGATLWIGDVGDNVTSTTRRERVAVWTMPVDGSKQPVLHRLAYPERKPHDAEALLVGPDNLPLIITKTLSGKAEIFTPAAPLKTNNTEPVPMKKVGEVSLPRTNTPNLLQGPGRVAITGAARSPDGSKVVLRTYADAFEYDVTGGDVLAALTTGKPRVTPLADPFGEAISYTADGASFVTVSDAGELGDDVEIEILAYQPSAKGAPPVAEKEQQKKAAGTSWTDGLSLDDITYVIAAVGVLGALLVGVGIVGIVRARRRPPTVKGGPYGTGDLSDPDAVERGSRSARQEPPPPAGGRGSRRGGVYGGSPPENGGRPSGRGGGGNVYGGGPPPGGAVYGGGAGGGGGGVYGGSSGGPGPAGGHGSGPTVGRGGPSGGRGGYGGAPGGGGRGASRGGYGGGRGGVYGGGRVEPPRRGAGSGRRDEPEHGRRGGRDPEGYGRASDRDHRGNRY